MAEYELVGGVFRCTTHDWTGLDCPECIAKEAARGQETSAPPAPERCVRCGGIVDAKGAMENRYCFCICKWPVVVVEGGQEIFGCGERIYFLVNLGERTQPFNLSDGAPHHGTCAAFRLRERPDTTCPRCFARRAKNGRCRGCGWQPRNFVGTAATDSPANVVRPLEGFR